MCWLTAVATADEAFAGSNPLERVKAIVASIDFPPLPFETALVEAGPPLQAASPSARVAAVATVASERTWRGAPNRLLNGGWVVLT
jgi:hypothetical protein